MNVKVELRPEPTTSTRNHQIILLPEKDKAAREENARNARKENIWPVIGWEIFISLRSDLAHNCYIDTCKSAPMWSFTFSHTALSLSLSLPKFPSSGQGFLLPFCPDFSFRLDHWNLHLRMLLMEGNWGSEAQSRPPPPPAAADDAGDHHLTRLNSDASSLTAENCRGSNNLTPVNPIFILRFSKFSD